MVRRLRLLSRYDLGRLGSALTDYGGHAFSYIHVLTDTYIQYQFLAIVGRGLLGPTGAMYSRAVAFASWMTACSLIELTLPE